MPIIALVFSTLGFWVIYWFVRMGGVDHVHAVLSRRKEGARRAGAPGAAARSAGATETSRRGDQERNRQRHDYDGEREQQPPPHVFTADRSHSPRHVNVTITTSIQRCESAAWSVSP